MARSTGHRVHAPGRVRLDRVTRPPRAASRSPPAAASASGSAGSTPPWRSPRPCREAHRSGHGEHIDVALLAVMSLTMNTYTSVVRPTCSAGRRRSGPTRTVEVPSIEPTADGYVCFTTNSAQQLADFLLLIGRPDQLDNQQWFRHPTRWAGRDEFLAMAHAYTTHPHQRGGARGGRGAADPERAGGQRRHRHHVRPLPGPGHVRAVAVGPVRAARGCRTGSRASSPARSPPRPPSASTTARSTGTRARPPRPALPPATGGSRSTACASSTSPRGGPGPRRATSSRCSAPT